MKQNIILEAADLDRLKAGEALQLTGNLLLSLQVTKKYKPRAVNAQTTQALNELLAAETEGRTPDELKKARKRAYQAKYCKQQSKLKPARTTAPTPCKLGCGKLLGSAQAFRGHKAHCPNRRKP